LPFEAHLSSVKLVRNVADPSAARRMPSEDDMEARNEALIEFIGTFSTVSEQVESITDLGDGVAIFEALSEM
jgi:hypothetical protein